MLTYDIKERGKLTRYEYLYKKIKEDILNGNIPSGSKLPSKRTFAEHNGISVITVEYAYQMLLEEGYIYSAERSGYFVCNISDASAGKQPPTLIIPSPIIDNKTEFPFSTFSKIMRRVITQYGEELLIKPPHNGCAILRNAISGYLYRYRGITINPERIVIGSGAEYLYMLIVQLLGRDMIYGIENPSYKKIAASYKANGAVCDLLQMDEHGVSDKELERTKADVLHITPFHSFPSGLTAPAAKRLAYLHWAQKGNRIIIEDDFDSEFVSGKPIETVFSMDKNDCVIYLNTFTKTLAPSLRVGYMILPEHLIDIYNEKLGFYSCSVPVFDQYFIAEFISEGHFERHLAKMRRKANKKQSKP